MKNIVLSMILIIGLVSFAAKANDVDELEKILGVEADVKITLGPGMLGLANLFTKDEPEAQAILAGLRDLSISVYELKDSVDATKLAGWLQTTVDSLSRKGLLEIVKIADGDERVHVLAKVNGTKLSDITVLVYTPGDEFVYISMDGDIDANKVQQVTKNFDININGLNAMSLSL